MRLDGIQNVIGGDPLGFRLKVEDQAVPQGRVQRSLDIFKTDIESTFGEGSDLGRYNKSLSSAWAAAKSKVLSA